MNVVMIALVVLVIINLLLSFVLIFTIAKSKEKQPTKIDVFSKKYEIQLYEWVENQTHPKPLKSN